MKQKILALAELNPTLLGQFGKLTYLICMSIPENADLCDKELTDVLDWYSEEHLEWIYSQICE